MISTDWQYHSFWHDFEKRTTSPFLLPSPSGGVLKAICFVKDVKQLTDTSFIIGTRQGIFEFNPGKERFKKLRFYRAGLLMTSDILLERIFIDAEKTVWLDSRIGIAHYNHLHESIGLIRNNDEDKISPGQTQEQTLPKTGREIYGSAMATGLPNGIRPPTSLLLFHR